MERAKRGRKESGKQRGEEGRVKRVKRGGTRQGEWREQRKQEGNKWKFERKGVKRRGMESGENKNIDILF